MSDHNDFTRRLKELIALEENQGEVARKLGYTGPRISQIARGERPSREFVERLVTAYNLNREEWLGLAGLGPKTVADEREAIAFRAAEEAVRRTSIAHRALNAASWFLAELTRIQHAHPHLFIPIPSFQGGVESLTMEEAEAMIRETEKAVDEGMFPTRPIS